LLAHGRWFSPGTPTNSTTKTGRHDIAEILLKVALSTINQIKSFCKYEKQILLLLPVDYPILLPVDYHILLTVDYHISPLKKFSNLKAQTLKRALQILNFLSGEIS
jgi:hypothetical protein